MRVLLVNGSPHEKGCTYTALIEVEDTLNANGIETELFWIRNQAIHGCTGCRSCTTKKKCVFDDRVNELLNIIGEYDGFIFGTPVHYAAASGAMTSFMDRAFYADLCSGNRNFYLKPAACVVSARRAGTTATYDQINKYFGLSQMPIISSQYWNMVHGAKPEDVEQDQEGLQTMRTLARNMAFFLKCKEIGLKNGVALPEKEQGIFTNFIRE